MKKLIIENKLYLVEDSTYIVIKINVPRSNIQNMIDVTGARLISKKRIELLFNHYAGEVFACEIRVKFSNIEKYLKTGSLFDADNRQQYLELRYGKLISHDVISCYKDSVGLYTFGECRRYMPVKTTHYWYYDGKRIELNDNSRTENGNKRYVKNNSKWASNRKY